jgi:hypothetical protein
MPKFLPQFMMTKSVLTDGATSLIPPPPHAWLEMIRTAGKWLMRQALDVQKTMH